MISIFADELNEELIAELKQRFGNFRMDLIVEDDLRSGETLSDEEFWELIDSLNWLAEEDDAIVAPLVRKLKEKSKAEIYQFEAILSRLLWELDAKVFAAPIFGEEYVSADDFLYARCAVVANGKAFYEEVKQQPDKMPVEVTFEPILSLAGDAFLAKTGEEMTYFPLYNYETYSNRTGWPEKYTG